MNTPKATQVYLSFLGNHEVKRLFIDASGAKDERSFGKTQIS